MPPRVGKLCIEADAAWDRGDLKEAFTLFSRAARLGHVAGQLNVGYFFDRGLFVSQDKQKALKWYHEAYEQGDPCGANNIATVYKELGHDSRALWWSRRAAAMGDPDLLLQLGESYELGLRLPRNLAKAKRLLISP